MPRPEFNSRSGHFLFLITEGEFGMVNTERNSGFLITEGEFGMVNTERNSGIERELKGYGMAKCELRIRRK